MKEKIRLEEILLEYKRKTKNSTAATEEDIRGMFKSFAEQIIARCAEAPYKLEDRGFNKQSILNVINEIEF